MLLLYAFMLLLHSCSTARAASRRQLQTIVVYGFRPGSHVCISHAPGQPAARARAGMAHVELEQAGAAQLAQIRVYVRQAVAARMGTSSGRPGPACAAIFDHWHVAGRIRRGKRVLHAALGYLSLPAPMSCGGMARALHVHSTSVQAIRDGAACPHLGGPSDRGAGLPGHCRRGVGEPEARGPRLSPVRLRIDRWSAPYHVYAVWVCLTRPSHHTCTHKLIPRRRDLSLHAGTPAAPGLDTHGGTAAEPTTRAHHLSLVAVVGRMA